MKRRNVVAVLLSIIIASSAFFACGLLLLTAEIGEPEATKTTDRQTEEIPYYNNDNAAVLFTLPDTSGLLIYLNFEESKIDLALYLDHAEEQAEKSRYKVFYTLKGNVDLITGICDRIGGIELFEGGAERRYYSTGLRQKLNEKLSRTEKNEIVLAFFEKIAKIGLSSNDFEYIIGVADTNISYPVCFGWVYQIKTIAANTKITD